MIEFGEEVVAAGFTVVMPRPFGTLETVYNPVTLTRSMAQMCISREFTELATGETTPIAGWLRTLAHRLHGELGGQGVGALGMCFTGDPAVGARFETLTRELGEAFIRVEFPGREHFTLTEQRQQEDVDRVLAFCVEFTGAT